MSGSVPGWINEFRSILPDFKPDDVAGSPYCIRDYLVKPAFGGPPAPIGCEGFPETARAETNP